MTVYNVKDVQGKIVKRIPTTIDELDFLYGYTEVGKNVAWGLPAGKMSIWAGEKGTGKSRAAVELCRTISRHIYTYKDLGTITYKVLYFQREVDLGTLKGWVEQDGGIMPNNFYCSESNLVDEQCADILSVAPKLVIVDSINTVKGLKGEDAIESAFEKYSTVCRETGCHIIFLNQLNADNKTPKGGSTIGHLVDVECILKRMGSDGFSMSTPQKNRYGKTGITIWWIHNKKKAYCESKFRLEDDDWCRTHHIKKRDIKAEGEAFRQQIVKEYAQEQYELQVQYDEETRKEKPLKTRFIRWTMGLD